MKNQEKRIKQNSSPKTSYKRGRNESLLVLTAFIWGVTFVAQRIGGDNLGPFTFGCIRSFIGAAALFFVIPIMDRLNLTDKKKVTKENWKLIRKGGILCGIFVAFTNMFQQLGLYLGTSVSKAGFLTASYIVMVPVLGIFLGKKCNVRVWLSVCITIFGLYLLCMKEGLTFQISDLFIILCAFMCAMHILMVDLFMERVEVIRMALVQLVTAGIVGIFPMFFIEMHHSLQGIMEWSSMFLSWKAWIPLLYAGIMSSGIAYTLQNVGQKGVNPSIASLILSLESVFSMLVGCIVFGERMNVREIIGCGLIFIAVLLAQMPHKDKHSFSSVPCI